MYLDLKQNLITEQLEATNSSIRVGEVDLCEIHPNDYRGYSYSGDEIFVLGTNMYEDEPELKELIIKRKPFSLYAEDRYQLFRIPVLNNKATMSVANTVCDFDDLFRDNKREGEFDIEFTAYSVNASSLEIREEKIKIEVAFDCYLADLSEVDLRRLVWRPTFEKKDIPKTKFNTSLFARVSGWYEVGGSFLHYNKRLEYFDIRQPLSTSHAELAGLAWLDYEEHPNYSIFYKKIDADTIKGWCQSEGDNDFDFEYDIFDFYANRLAILRQSASAI